jgi:regulator of sigma E protease
LLTAIAAIIVFGLLIGVHEAGHLIAAKLNKVEVTEFAIGMGPKLFSFQGKETLYSLRLIPIGGYCKLTGEDEEIDSPVSFSAKKPLQRISILAAGAIMNLVLGFVALVILFAPNEKIVTTNVGAVLENAPAYTQGLKAGDKIIKLNSTDVNINADLSFFLYRNGGKDINVTVERDGKKVVLNITPHQDNGSYYIGYTPVTIENNFWETLKYAYHYEIFTSKVVVLTLADMFTGAASVKDTSGPVGIVNEIGKAAQNGFRNVLYLLALISVNLGLFNLLPLPALDGGRILFVLIEFVFRRPVPQKYEAIVHAIGFLALLVLMVFVTFNDVFRLIGN